MRWIGLCVFLLAATPAHAQEFELGLNASYSVAGPRQVSVVQDITITNATASAFPNQVSVVVPVATIESLRVISGDELVTFEQTAKPNGTVLNLDLSTLNPIIGRYNSRTLRLEYQAPALAYGSQSVLDVFIPQADSGLTKNRVIVSVPPSYNQPVSISAEASTSGAPNQLEIEDYNSNSGLFIQYGSKRVVELELKRVLTNGSSNPRLFQIPLPPSTQSQRVVLTSIDPKPAKISLDPDGNSLAEYVLNPNESIEVQVLAEIELSRSPRSYFSREFEHNLSSGPIWTVQSPEVQSLAKSLTDPAMILQKLSDRYDYAYAKRVRKPSSQLLTNAVELDAYNAVDIIISLLRAKHIPARQLYGLVLGSESQLRPLAEPDRGLHTYIEYFDTATETWYMLDPTWTLTNGAPISAHLGSVSHITLMINGQSPLLPELPSADTMTVSARDLDRELQLPAIAPTTELLVTPLTKLGIISPAKVVITNDSGLTLDSLKLESNSHRVHLKLPPIPPYGQHTQSVVLVPERWFSREPVSMLVYAGEDQFPVQIKVNFSPNLVRLIILVLAGAGTTGAIVAGSVLVYRFRRRSSLRRKSQ